MQVQKAHIELQQLLQESLHTLMGLRSFCRVHLLRSGVPGVGIFSLSGCSVQNVQSDALFARESLGSRLAILRFYERAHKRVYHVVFVHTATDLAF